ncbi:Platinum sensitivity protein, partial [Physocladia obscura]
MYQTLWIITNRRTAATRILPSLRPRNSVLTLAFDRPYILRTLYRFYSANIKSEIRNEAIQYSSVQVIGPGKTKHGVLQIREARQLAAEELMDLILVDETTTPPTCRLVISPTLSAKISSQASTASKLLDSPKNKEIIELGHSTVLLVLNTTTAKPDEYAPEKQQTVKHLSTFEALALRRQDEDLILLQVQTGKASDTTHTNEKLVDGTTVESTKEHDSRPVAVCKIYSRKELLEAVQKGKRVFKSAAKTPVAATSMSAPVKIKNEVKDVEIKTAISPHDFEIKLKKVVELLKKGYGVQLKIREPKKGVAGAKIAEKTFMNAKNAITESGLKYEVTEIVKPLPIGGEVPVETETLQKYSPFLNSVLKQKKKLSTKPTNMSMTTVDSRRRVKLYKLDEAGVWEDRGTGCVQVKELVWIHVDRETDEATPSKTQTQTESQSNQSKSDTDSSVVLSDSAVADSSNSNSNEINDSHDTNNPSVLLKTRIRSEANFTRQQDTLVVWTEEDGTDMALSFQEQEGCEDLWRAIREIKAKLGGTVSDPGIDNLSRQSEDDDNGDDRGFAFDGTLSLPTPSMGTIKDIEELMFGTSKGAYGRGQLTKFIIEENYIEKMLPLLEMCEDLESFDELYSLAHIVKMIDDRDYPSAKSTLRQQVASAEFKQLIPFPEALVAKKIKQTYRIQFLRDTALARMLDDATYASLNSIVFFNQAEIISWFVSPNGGEQYLEKVIGILNEEDAGPDAANVKREDVVLFLHELSSVAKGMQTTLRTRYYRIMAKLGLFAIFDYTLVHEDIKIRLAAAAILASILDHNPAL